jgi:hypothetical protein
MLIFTIPMPEFWLVCAVSSFYGFVANFAQEVEQG